MSFRRQEDRCRSSAYLGTKWKRVILEKKNGAVAFTANEVIEAAVRIMAPNGPSDDALLLRVEPKATEALSILRNVSQSCYC